MTPEEAQAAVADAEKALAAARRTRNRIVYEAWSGGGSSKYTLAQRLEVTPRAIRVMLDNAQR